MYFMACYNVKLLYFLYFSSNFFFIYFRADPAYGRRGRSHKIVFRHSVTNGNWVLIIDGRFEAAGYEPITSSKFSVSFKLGNSNCYVEAATQNLIYQHEFYIENKIQVPFNKQVESPATETIPTQVSVPLYVRQTEANNKEVIFYQVLVKTGYGDEITIYHRYSEFDLLDKCIKSQLDGHLRSSLPSLPGKIWNPFVDQFDEDFLQTRRLALQRYLVTLLGNSKVCLIKNHYYYYYYYYLTKLTII